MFARKLSRLAGLVFVLAAIFSGAGAATLSDEHVADSAAVHAAVAAGQFQLEATWG